MMNGKGDKPRPFSIPLEQFGNEFDRIFGPKPERQAEKAESQPAQSRGRTR